MQPRSKTVQKRSFARQVSFEPWKLDPEFPFHLVDYTHKRRDLGPFHIHDVLEIGWCHSGSGIFMVEDKAYTFGAGDIYVISSLEAHYAYPPCGTPSDWTFLFCDPVRLIGAAADPGLLDLSRCCGARFDNRFRPESSPGLCAAVRELSGEFRARGPHFRDAILAHVIQILVELKRRSTRMSGQNPARQRESSRATLYGRSYERMQALAPALKIVARDYARSLPLNRLAKACFMSGSHFRRLFTSQLGVSPRDYLLGYRIAMAACLLTGTQTPVTQISYDTGFQSLSSFNRQFQKRKGCSPRAWRKQA